MSDTKTFSDELLTCESCGKTFVFRVPEQRRMYETQGTVAAPSECPQCRLEVGDTGRLRGEVKWFDAQKGYGFIRKPDGDEIFFHRNSLASADPSNVMEGRQVLFEERESPKGPEAVEVELVE